MEKFISESMKVHLINLVKDGKFNHEKAIAGLELYLTDRLVEMGRPDLYHRAIFTSKEINLIKDIVDRDTLEAALLHIEALAQELLDARIYKLLQLSVPFSREENNFKWAKERMEDFLSSLTGEHTDKAKFIEIAAYAISCYRGMYKRDQFTASNLDWSDQGKYEENLKHQRELQSPNFYFEYRENK